MKQIIIGNWKMFGLTYQVKDLVTKLLSGLKQFSPQADIVICPPATQLSNVASLIHGSQIALGGQDCQADDLVTHTGDISAEMLKDIGAQYVIIGHSERREIHHETDAIVQTKTVQAQDWGLIPIVCVGETEIERRTGAYRDSVKKQINEGLPDDFNGIVAYEPIWAIHGGMSASLQEISSMMQIIRKELAKRFNRTTAEGIRILYGGSVNPDNAESILSLEGVNGVLIGSASLSAEKFLAIIRSSVVENQE
ncbi:triose-phosphate isomerase [Entomobacter blattae]|uniref:Triosephosphate isomerase n=1 Tax=Entomobacter blattae TaxID=2762277 RepID=A0A7H1NSF3_9PROT|nr:triose-phosphate isomerase [Entomobacter blattae]QNT78713.1 Triosephosphate isomerase [Entomobacter blattae]